MSPHLVTNCPLTLQPPGGEAGRPEEREGLLRKVERQPHPGLQTSRTVPPLRPPHPCLHPPPPPPSGLRPGAAGSFIGTSSKAETGLCFIHQREGHQVLLQKHPLPRQGRKKGLLALLVLEHPADDKNYFSSGTCGRPSTSPPLPAPAQTSRGPPTCRGCHLGPSPRHVGSIITLPSARTSFHVPHFLGGGEQNHSPRGTC